MCDSCVVTLIFTQPCLEKSGGGALHDTTENILNAKMIVLENDVIYFQ